MIACTGVAQSCARRGFRLDVMIFFFFFFWRWSNTGTGFPVVWKIPHDCQCSRCIWIMPLICFSFWLALKWSGRRTWRSSSVPSSWIILFYSVLFHSNYIALHYITLHSSRRRLFPLFLIFFLSQHQQCCFSILDNPPPVNGIGLAWSASVVPRH